MEKPMHEAILAPERRKSYMLAGRAKVTVVSNVTDTRFTYKINSKEVDDFARPGEKKKLHFVSVLNGSNNETDYAFLGTIFCDGQFRRSDRSNIAATAPSMKAFVWLWSHMDSLQMEVWHSGECGRCGRDLTDPESIARGLGPTCAEYGA
jgi:hypothetical protein